MKIQRKKQEIGKLKQTELQDLFLIFFPRNFHKRPHQHFVLFETIQSQFKVGLRIEFKNLCQTI